MPLQWKNPDPGHMEPRGYLCSYCDRSVGPDKGWHTQESHSVAGNRMAPIGVIYICSFCGKPTFFEYVEGQDKQHPAPAFGNVVGSLPPDVAALYTEARSSMKVNAFTAAVLTCRKLLMHLAVEKGAPGGSSFLEYVEYLAQKGYVPPNGLGWVDHIRKKGNEANHEIRVMVENEAKDLITFTEMLLKFDYEFPAKVQPLPKP